MQEASPPHSPGTVAPLVAGTVAGTVAPPVAGTVAGTVRPPVAGTVAHQARDVPACTHRRSETNTVSKVHEEIDLLG